MKMLPMSFHASQRRQQRRISELQIALIGTFGDDHYQSGGSTLTYVPRKRIEQLRAALDRLDMVALIKNPDESVATVMHLQRRISRTNYVS